MPSPKKHTSDRADAMGVTPLMHAAKENDIEKIADYVAAKHDLNAIDKSGLNALLYAVASGHEDAAKMLMFHKAELTHKTRAGFSALHVAADKNMFEVVERWALAKGPLDDQETIDGHTPLMKAILKENAWIAIRLIDAGADFDKLKNKEGKTAEEMGRWLFDGKDRKQFIEAIERRHAEDLHQRQLVSQEVSRVANKLPSDIEAPARATFTKKDRGPKA